MKKIFSLALMATALLISGQVTAATKSFNVATEQALRNAFKSADPGDVVTITLTDNIELKDSSLVIGAKATTGGADGAAARTINLNLGGFELYSNVIITAKGVKPAVVDFPMIRLNKGILNVSNGTINHKGTGSSPVIDIYGSLDKTDANFSVVNIAKDAKIISTFYALVITESKVGSTTKDPEYGDWDAAYGTVIYVDGYVYGGKYGIKVNGNIRGDGNNIPKVTVSSTAEIACASNSTAQGYEKDGCACYSSGVGNWFIYGNVHGNIGMVVKGGNVTIENATIKGEGEGYDEITKGGSGINGGAGCGIAIVSQSNYPGQQVVTVKGDSKIEAKDGYAINETVPQGDTKESECAKLVIEGGTIVGGEEGAIIITEKVAKDTSVVKVYGGQVQGENYAGSTEIALDSLKAKGTFVITVDINGVETQVVTKGEKPAEEPVKLSKATAASVIIAEGGETIKDNLTLGYVQMTNATSDTIAKGVTVKIDKLIMGDSAQFVIMPGAKLLIMGEQGIVAGQYSNIVVKADATGMGMFLFNPAVASNRTPKATVEVYAKEAYSYPNQKGYAYEIIVCPFAAVSEINYELDETKTMPLEGGAWSGLQIWKNNQWVGVTRTQACAQLKAFMPIAMTSSADPTKTVIKYSIKGQLQGNISGLIPAGKNYNYMGNAYLAPMNSEDFIAKVKANDKLINNMWFWKGQNFKIVTEDNLDDVDDINPLGFFVLKATGDVNVDFDYNNLIWLPNKD